MTFMLVVNTDLSTVPVLATEDQTLVADLIQKPVRIIARPTFYAYIAHRDVRQVQRPRVNVLASTLLYPIMVVGPAVLVGMRDLNAGLHGDVPRSLLDVVVQTRQRLAMVPS